jgi:hypothetical protein
VIFWLVACAQSPESVVLYGIVEDAPDGEGSPVEGASLTSLDEDGLASADPYGTTETLEDGSFVIEVPAGEAFFLTVEAAEHVSTAWSGTAGLVDVYAGEGVPWVATPEWVDGIRAAHAACESVTDADAVVTGEVRQSIDSADYGEMPLLSGAVVTVTDSQNNTLPTCYLDDEGASDAAATETGTTGEFAVFGVPEGPVLVDVVVGDRLASYRYRVPSGGAVPMFPALIEGL